jgi:hypothetical protein
MVKKIVYSTYVYAISSNCPNFFYVCMYTTEAGFMDEIQTKFCRVFLLAIHSHLCFALRFLFLQTHATSDSFYSAVTKQCKGDRRKTS